MNPIISTEEVVRYEDLIKLLVAELDPHAAAIANDDFYGAAFRYSLLFSEGVTQATSLSRLNDAELFYNRYYWFFLFTKLHEIRLGHDAGLDQQAYKLLEAAPDSVDWQVVEQIDNRVENEIAVLKRRGRQV